MTALLLSIAFTYFCFLKLVHVELSVKVRHANVLWFVLTVVGIFACLVSGALMVVG